MSEAGILISGHRLQPSATTVRVRDGRTQLSESHHSDAPEQLGGFYVIDVASPQEAISWAVRCPARRDRGAADLGLGGKTSRFDRLDKSEGRAHIGARRGVMGLGLFATRSRPPASA
jgi:YCII-related domain